MNVSGGEANISRLSLSTEYSIEVAAVSGEYGIGLYSSLSTTAVTDGESRHCIYMCHTIYSDLCNTTGLLSVSHVSSSNTTLKIALTLTLSTEPGTTASYTISYSNTNTDCFDTNGVDAIRASETMYTLTDLQEGTEYSITVTVLVMGETIALDSLTATTMNTG